MRKIIFISLLTLAGCQSTTDNVEILTPPEVITEIPEQREGVSNSLLEKATIDVMKVVDLGAEWQVKDKVTKGKAINLSDLLIVAKNMDKNGDQIESTRLAEKISRIANLALQQFYGSRSAMPVYYD